jgi:hypothetical protein
MWSRDCHHSFQDDCPPCPRAHDSLFVRQYTPESHKTVSTTPESPTAVRGLWTDSEDEQLREAVLRFGTNHWDSVTEVVPTRTAAQCRERWTFRLRPGLNKGPFEHWEDEIILKERARIGNRWAVIAREIPGRTSSAVKNRWYSELRKDSGLASEADWDNCPFSINHLLSRPPCFRPSIVAFGCLRKDGKVY